MTEPKVNKRIYVINDESELCFENTFVSIEDIYEAQEDGYIDEQTEFLVYDLVETVKFRVDKKFSLVDVGSPKKKTNKKE